MKDGSVEESDRIWESEKYIHFILKGTASVEIRFLKEIVLRVESDSITFPAKPAGELHVPSDADRNSSEKSANLSTAVEAPDQRHVYLEQPDDRLVTINKGIPFYDPRRKQRYWAGRNAHFATLDESLKAIAVKYKRPTAWVVDHMGEENDIGVIYANLNHRLAQEAAENQGRPRRVSQPPVSTSKSTKGAGIHKERNPLENISDSAQIEGTATDQVQHLPEETLTKKASGTGSEAVGPAGKEITTRPRGTVQSFQIAKAMPLDALQGIQFYDPRRPQKYWVAPNERYDTLNAALKALAVQYNTTVQWVENHIGNTNVLSEIHENIRKSIHP